jgi:hypothetical protein
MQKESQVLSLLFLKIIGHKGNKSKYGYPTLNTMTFLSLILFHFHLFLTKIHFSLYL